MVWNNSIDYNLIASDHSRIPPSILLAYPFSVKSEDDKLFNFSTSDNLEIMKVRDNIWISAAIEAKTKIQMKIKSEEIKIINDIRFIVKDLDDVQRIKASGNSKNLLEWDDLPSMYEEKKKKEADPDLRKQFLRDLCKRHKNK